MKAKLTIDDAGTINHADIDINKINVVGGVNTSGKSIVSKLLYCYLKSKLYDESLDFLIDSEGSTGVQIGFLQHVNN